MSKAERTIKDAAKLYGSQLGAAAFGILFSAWLARSLPSAELSIWPVCTGLVGLVEVIGGLGMGNVFPRCAPPLLGEGKRAEAAALLRSGLVLMGTGATVLSLLIVLAAQPITHVLLKDEVDAGLVRMLSPAVLFTVLTMYLNQALFSVQAFGKAALSKLILNVLRPPASVAGYLLWGIQGAVWALCLVPLLGFLLSLYWLRGHLVARGARRGTWGMLHLAGPFYAASLVNMGTNRLDYLIVGTLTNPEKLAAYYVARKIVEYLWHLDISLLDAVTPKLAERSSRPREELAGIFSRCSRYLFLGLMPLHAGLAALAGPVIFAYAGDRYPTAAPILAVLSVSVFAEAFAGLHRRHTQVLGDRWHLFVLDGVAGTANVGFSLLLVVRWAGMGSAVSQLVGFFLQGLVGFLLLGRTFRVRYDITALRLASVGSLPIAGLGLLAAHYLSAPWALSVGFLTSVAAYLLLLRKRLTPADVDLLLGLVPARLLRGEQGGRLSTRLRAMLCHPWTDQRDRGVTS